MRPFLTHDGRHPRAGLSLLEVLVSAAVMGLILIAVGIVAKTGNGVFRSAQVHDGMRQDLQRVLERIADAVAMSGKTSFSPTPVAPLGSSSLEFRVPTGMTAGSVDWGTRTRIAFEYTAGDPNNGHDDDGDGFVDDGDIVLVQDVGGANERTTILARHVAEYADGESPNAADDNGNGLVDEKGLSFVLDGDQLTIRITVVELDPDAHPLLVTGSTRLRLRN